MHPRANSGCSEQALPMEGNEISSHEGAPCSDMLHTPSAAELPIPKLGHNSHVQCMLLPLARII